MIRFVLVLLTAIFLGFNSLPAQASGSLAESINQYDENGLKVGYWIIKGHMVNATNYKPDQKIEEGNYVANKRQGLWKKYHTNGHLKSEINYENNRPFGFYKLYYSSGEVQEEGNWVRERNTGQFRRYHPNGAVAQEFSFTDAGLRTGNQRYYYDNGNLEMEVEIVDGVEEGVMKRYYPNGDLMEEKELRKGIVEKSSIKKYPVKNKVLPEDISAAQTEKKYSVRNTEDRPNLEVFRHNGRNVLYNKNRQVSQIGEFRDGRLWNGKWKKYDQNGIIEKIEIYKEGIYIGNAPITDDDL